MSVGSLFICLGILVPDHPVSGQYSLAAPKVGKRELSGRTQM